MNLKAVVKQAFKSFGFEIKRVVPGYHYDQWRAMEKIMSGQQPQVIFDVGANVGQTAREFAPRFPKSVVYSFEPCKDTFEKLVKNIRGFSNVTPVRMALGAEEGEKTINRCRMSQMNSFLEEDAGWSASDGREIVQVGTLDSFCLRRNIKAVDILKIDTQGFDLEVLKGGVGLLEANRIRLLCVEVNFVPLYKEQPLFEDVYLVAKKHGFKLTALYDHQYQQDVFLWWADALFVNPCFVATT